MPDLTKLGSDRANSRSAPTGSPTRPTARGTIAVAPGAITDPVVFVTLPDYSPERPWQCRWMPKGTALPVQGAACLVEFDNTGAGFVTWWEGDPEFAGGGGGGGSTLTGLWRWTNSGTASGQIKAIGASWAAATEIQVSKINSIGGDVANILAAIAPGDRLFLQEHDDSTRWGEYLVASPGVDHSTYVSYPVTFSKGAGAFPANNAVTVFAVTTPGVPGPAGPAGPQGPAGIATTFVHTQGALSATWVVAHPLNKRPSVTVIDTGDRVVLANVHYDSDNQVTITFDNATSGKVYLN